MQPGVADGSPEESPPRRRSSPRSLTGRLVPRRGQVFSLATPRGTAAGPGRPANYLMALVLAAFAAGCGSDHTAGSPTVPDTAVSAAAPTPPHAATATSALPTPTLTPADTPTPTPVPARNGVVIGTLLLEGGDTYLIESATGNRYRLPRNPGDVYMNAPVYAFGSLVPGAMSYSSFGRMLNSQGGCSGVFRRADSKYFVGSSPSSSSDCNGIELIEVPASQLDQLIGVMVEIRFRGCTPTREGRLVNPIIFPSSQLGPNAPFYPPC
jgi:hypothetical protein